MKKLEETNVKLAEIQCDDVQEFFRIAHSEDIKKFVKILYPSDTEEANIIIEMLNDNSNYISYKILNNQGEFVGIILGEKKGKGIIDVSYFIGKEYRKNGYCTIAVEEFMKILKNENIRGINFSIDPKNRNSQRVMKRLRIPMKYKRVLQVYELIF